MSRVGGDVITVRPTNNIYTVLSGVALVAVVLGLLMVGLRMYQVFGGIMSAPQPQQRSVR
jgi:hypothetical protein